MRETYANLNSFVDLLLWRDGGQRHARRNAWRSMVADNLRSRDRVEAAIAVAGAVATAGAVSSSHGSHGEGRHIL
jgi:hypothetical protein